MPALLEFRQISKSYGSVQANAQVSFSVGAGSIHALVGENGAGKSTLMKILFGLEKADHGQIFFKGQAVQIANPRFAKKLGFGMIHQHFQLAEAMTALDHVLLEQAPRGPFSFFEKLDRKACLKQMQDLSEKFRMPVPWTETVDKLSVGIQQRIEILRLLAYDAEVLILDEPTAVLTPLEIEQFLERLRELKAAGKTILLITHKLKEVFAVADHVTVLRQGQAISSGPIQGETEASLASKMVGAEFRQHHLERKAAAGAQPLLKVQKLSARRDERWHLQDIDFSLRAGEILGVAGVEGNGQSELIRALTLAPESDFAWTGQALLQNQDLLTLNNAAIRKLGVGLVPEDRLRQAVIPSLTAKENFQLGRSDLNDRFTLRPAQRDQELQKALGDFAVTPKDPNLLFKSFSGGNQQKIVLARELGGKPRLLIVAQPTRGVDIGAIEAIYETLIEARNQGLGILLISSELEELLRLSDRMLVLCRGQIRAELEREKFDMGHIGRLMGGAS